MRHLDLSVGNIFLLLLINIKYILSLGSSKIFNKALTELMFKCSILSIITSLGLLLKDDLFSGLILNKSNPNFISIDIEEDKKSIDINQIRNLISSLNKSSFNKKPRFVLIDNIELLNVNSVNALLKIVEEPNDNIYFILINNNKNILPTLKSRCLNFNIYLTSNQSLDIANKILAKNCLDLIHEEILNHYSTPGWILNLLDFADKNDLDLKEINLKELIKKIIMDKKYKKDQFTKDLLYSLIEVYFRINVSVKNIELLKIQNYFLKKINNTKIFNLDDESLLMEFEERVLNG